MNTRVALWVLEEFDGVEYEMKMSSFQDKEKARRMAIEKILNLLSAYDKFPDIFVLAFKFGIDSWKFSMVLLYILCDDWQTFMISGLNEQLQQQLEYTLLNLILTAGEFQKCNLDARTL